MSRTRLTGIRVCRHFGSEPLQTICLETDDNCHNKSDFVLCQFLLTITSKYQFSLAVDLFYNVYLSFHMLLEILPKNRYDTLRSGVTENIRAPMESQVWGPKPDLMRDEYFASVRLPPRILGHPTMRGLQDIRYATDCDISSYTETYF
ncbi:hypothetical protein TNCV_2764061 [Trichonephila clavipes]|nr:hypothetical protein TNCV_2764061 [Trichonephila clavipes]